MSFFTDRQERAVRRNSTRGDYNKEAEAAVEQKKLANRNAEQDEELRELKSLVGYKNEIISRQREEINKYKQEHPNSTQDNDSTLRYYLGWVRERHKELLTAESKLRVAEDRNRRRTRSAAGSASSSAIKF